jgi:hypothetical protein
VWLDGFARLTNLLRLGSLWLGGLVGFDGCRLHGQFFDQAIDELVEDATRRKAVGSDSQEVVDDCVTRRGGEGAEGHTDVGADAQRGHDEQRVGSGLAAGPASTGWFGRTVRGQASVGGRVGAARAQGIEQAAADPIGDSRVEAQRRDRRDDHARSSPAPLGVCRRGGE